MTEPIISVRNLTVKAGFRTLLDKINLDIPSGGTFGLVGPSGGGKSTLLKSVNRLIELTPGIAVTGSMKLKGKCVYDRDCDPDHLRTRIGMMFQQPIIFPTSIFENVGFGIKRLGNVPKRDVPATIEQALRDAALWEEVKDRLRASALRLSTGQQQRLCLARALACRPDVILMDEPTSALDNRSTAAIEELILDLKTRHTIVLVTHHLPQAARTCDQLALLEGGIVVLTGPAQSVLESSQLRTILAPSQ